MDNKGTPINAKDAKAADSSVSNEIIETNKALIEDKVNLASTIWSEQQQTIQFADAKANFNLIICVALFTGFIIESEHIGSLIKKSTCIVQVLLIIFGALAFFLIGASFLSSLWVVLPRFGEEEAFNNNLKPVPFFCYIAKSVKSAKQLYEEINELTSDKLFKIRTCQAFELAQIANTKMRWARRSVMLTFGSVIFASLFFVLVVLVQ